MKEIANVYTNHNRPGGQPAREPRADRGGQEAGT